MLVVISLKVVVGDVERLLDLGLYLGACVESRDLRFELHDEIRVVENAVVDGLFGQKLGFKDPRKKLVLSLGRVVTALEMRIHIFKVVVDVGVGDLCTVECCDNLAVVLREKCLFM